MLPLSVTMAVTHSCTGCLLHEGIQRKEVAGGSHPASTLFAKVGTTVQDACPCRLEQCGAVL